MKEDDEMIRKIFILTTMIMLISITAVAEDHNYIYKSDIRTYIDNQEITSYNIGGKTLVKATDMRRYGFVYHYRKNNLLCQTMSLKGCTRIQMTYWVKQ